MSYWCHYVILVSSVKGMTRSGLLLPNKNWGIKKWSRGPLSANLSVLPDILFISLMGSIYFCSSIKDVRIRFYSKYCCSNISQLKNRIIGIERTSRAFFPDIPLFHSGLPKPFPKCILFAQTLRKKHPTVCFRVQHGQCWKLLPSQSKCIQSKSTFFLLQCES